MLHADVVTTTEEANALHAQLAVQMDAEMNCDQRHFFPPATVISAALTRKDLTLYAAYDDDSAIAGGIVVTNPEHPKYRQVAWFYAAAGRHDDALAVLGPQWVSDVGTPYGNVQNPAVTAAFQRAFPGQLDTDATTLTWTG